MVFVESFPEPGEPRSQAFEILSRDIRGAVAETREGPVNVADRPQVVGLAEEGVTVEGVVAIVFAHRGQGFDGLDHGPVRRFGIERVARPGGRRAEQVLGQGGVEEAGVLLRRIRIPAHDEAAQVGEDVADILHPLRPAQRLARVGEQRERQDRARTRDGQRTEHRTEPPVPGVGGPGLVEQFRIGIVHRARQLGQVGRRIGQDSVGQQAGDEPVLAGPVEDGSARRFRNAPACQVTVEVVARGRAVVERVPRRASGCVGPRGDDQAEVARALTERLAHCLARAIAELVEAVEDDPDLGSTCQARQRPKHLPGEEVEHLALRARNASLELRDGVGELRQRASELPLQVVSEAALVGGQAEDRDGVHEPVRDVAAGDLGPGQRHRQARLARAGRARQHDHRVRPGGLDQLIQLGRGLEILGLLQDLGAARAVLPEDLAGVARGSAPGRGGHRPRCRRRAAAGDSAP